MQTELTTAERHCLTAYEAVIAQGMESFIDVGNALCQIRDGELYRDKYNTFAEYVGDRWNMKRAHAYRLMFASEVAMSPIGDKVGWKPDAESQVREVATIPEEHRETVLSEAVEKHGPTPTAAQIKEVAAGVIEPDIDRPQVSTAFVGEIDLEDDDAKDREDAKFRSHIKSLREMIDNREPAALVGWDRDIADLRRYVQARRNGQ